MTILNYESHSAMKLKVGLLTIYFGILTGVLFSQTEAIVITVEHCSSERLSLQCSSPGELIFIHKAHYGRMRPGRCVSAKYTSSLGCQTEVTSDLITLCSGSANCSIPVSIFDTKNQPCELDFKSYLETTYECSPVSFLDDCRQGNITKLTAPTGYLALFPQQSYEPTPGRSSPVSTSRPYNQCYWLVTVEPGMVIDINWKVLPPEDGSIMTNSCPDPLLFRDGFDEPLKPGICRTFTHPRSSFIHTSRSSSLEIHVSYAFVSRQDSYSTWRPYILQYKASGCADFDPPDGAEAVRNGPDVTISCESSLQKWTLHCEDGQWYGMIGNCTKPAHQNIKRAGVTRGYDEIKHGVLLAVSVGIVLGILVGAVMMFLIFIVKKSRERSERRRGRLQGSTLCDVYKNKSCRCPALFVRDRLGAGGVEGGIGPLYEYTYACTSTDEALTADTGLDISTLELCDTPSNRNLKLQSLSHDPDLYGYGSTVTSDGLSETNCPRKSGDTSVILCDLDRISCSNNVTQFRDNLTLGRHENSQIGFIQDATGCRTCNVSTACVKMSNVEHCACGRPKAIGSLSSRCGAIPNIVKNYNDDTYQSTSNQPA